MFPNILDYMFLILIVLCYLLSSLRAGPKQLFSFVAVIAAFIFAGRSYGEIASIFPEQVFPESFAGSFSFFIIFLAAFGIISLVGRLFENLFNRISFGIIDSFVNKGLGLLKGFMLGCMTVAVLMINYTLKEAPILPESVSLPHIMPAVRFIATLLPPTDQKLFNKTDQELQKTWTTSKQQS